MSAYHQILYHIVFRTKYSEKSIRQEYSSELYKYIWGIIKNKKCVLFRINRNIIRKKFFRMKLNDYLRNMASIRMKNGFGWMSKLNYYVVPAGRPSPSPRAAPSACTGLSTFKSFGLTLTD